ncbi:hypothetical protein [Diaphorobacter caeni]|uniref:hypothetical protein n=1 Tax=Diaphorobacter caeni TaxID=2784387 RepID=UPI00188FA621|nr:hypothetical protein [Diaphorobacter caeni]MBF5002936.1 hypothetical protein [Diaphorobacter caeni]
MRLKYFVSIIRARFSTPILEIPMCGMRKDLRASEQVGEFRSLEFLPFGHEGKGMMFKKWIAGCALAMSISVPAMAAPAPFGLEIGKATVGEMKNKHSARSSGTNAYSGGAMYQLDVSRIEFDGLKSVLVIFNPAGKVEGVVATLEKDRFDEISRSLSGKYKTVSKKLPFVGDKRIVWVDGGTEIELNAPHMSFVMTMQYVTKDLLKKFNNTENENAKSKARNEASQL